MIEIIKDPQFEKKLKKNVSEFEDATVLYDDFILKNSDGKLVAIYKKNFIDEQFGDFFNEIKFKKSDRLSKLLSKSEIFGFANEDLLRNHAARACSFNKNYFKKYEALKIIATKCEEIFEKYDKKTYQVYFEMAGEISKNWKIGDSNYSSGIINYNTQHFYHLDRGNLEKTYSSMITFKKGIIGGDLHLPEYNLTIKNDSSSLLIFDGAGTSHGVTPFKKTKLDSYRITIVFYCLENLKKCAETQQEEINNFNKRYAKNTFKKNQKLFESK